MKHLKFILIIALVHLIRVMISVAIGRHITPVTIGVSVGCVVFLSLLLTLKMRSVSRELDHKLKVLAELREVDRELDRVLTQYRSSASEATQSNTVTPISLVGDTWVAGASIPVSNPPIEPPAAEPNPTENRLTRVLKDNYPL